jgi:hypothetical protein
MANHANVSVRITPVGPKPATTLESEAAAVPVDTATLLLLGGVVVGSDVTSIDGHGQVVRTWRLDFTPAFKALFPNTSDQRAPFWGFMCAKIGQALKTRALASSVVLT